MNVGEKLSECRDFSRLGLFAVLSKIHYAMEAQLHDRVKEDRIRELPKLIEAEDDPILVELLARELRHLLNVDGQPTET